MMGIQVLTFEASQPRKRTPISVIYAILRVVNLAVFWEVQCVFLILTVLFTYTRSECPCPKKATGRDSYDMDAHFNVQDFDPSGMPEAKIKGMWVRFRRTKMDQRIERTVPHGAALVRGRATVHGGNPRRAKAPILGMAPPPPC